MVACVLSYTREVIFEMINSLIAGSTTNYSNHTTPDWMINLHMSDLYRLKWIGVGIFGLIFVAINISIVQIAAKQLLRPVILAYVILICSCFLLFGLHHFVQSKWIYSIFQIPYSLTQNIVPTMILLVLSLNSLKKLKPTEY